MKFLISQNPIPLYDEAEGQLKFKEIGPLGEATDPTGLFNKFLNGVVGVMTVVAFIWFLFLLITGAIGIMTAGGDKTAVQNNTKKITNGLIGIVVLILALVIIRVVGYLLGFDTGNFYFLNPGQFIEDFSLQ